MCGRYFFFGKGRPENISPKLSEMLLMKDTDRELIEVKPGDTAPIFFRSDKVYRTESMRWGFITDNSRLIINARCETLHAKAQFRDICKKQRCVVPASGYYEWRRGDGQKYAFLPTADNGSVFMAGLYRIRDDKSEFVVITRSADEAVIEIHDRMPLILPDRDAAARWLQGEPLDGFTAKKAGLRIEPCGDEQMKMMF